MHSTGQRGFVLVLTIWILAIITIGAAYFAERVFGSIQLARQSKMATEALLEMSGTRAEILFRLGTTRPSIYGVGPTPQSAIALDNRPYRSDEGDIVRLQDSRGLINVNYVQPEMLRRLLGQLGVAAEKRDAMLDTLSDFTDTDDLRRLNGAEEPEYRALGLPPPPNDWLITPWQLKGIIGWREQDALWKDGKIFEVVTTARVIGFNPNTAPRDAIAAIPSSSPEIADNLIRLRANDPLTGTAQLGPIAAIVSSMSDNVIFFPGPNLQLTQESDKIPWRLHCQIEITPSADRAPWRIDFCIKTDVTGPTKNANNASKLPARVAISAITN